MNILVQYLLVRYTYQRERGLNHHHFVLFRSLIHDEALIFQVRKDLIL